MTSSVTSSSAEEPPPYDQSAAATSGLEVISQEPEPDSKNRAVDSPGAKAPQKSNGNCESRVAESPFENGAELVDRLEITEADSQGLAHTHVTDHSESGDNMTDGKYVLKKGDDSGIVDREVMRRLDRDENRNCRSEGGKLKLRGTLGNELQENGTRPEDGHIFSQQGWKIHKSGSSPENESADGRKQRDDGVRNNKTSIKIPQSLAGNTYRLQNGKNRHAKNGDVHDEGKLYIDNMIQTTQLTPKPKPRTVLPNMTKN
jgi:hypothetical protein